METVRIQNGNTEKITAAFFDNASPPAAITGETVPLSIWRESDNEWYTGAGWQAGYTTFNMSELAQGYYIYNFNTSGFSDDTYHMRAVCSNVSCTNPIQEGELKVGYYVDEISEILTDTNETQGKLPTNEIMGSSTKSDKDDEIDAIKTVTDNLPNNGSLTDIDTGVNNIEAKLPTNYIMGSGVQSDKDDEIDTILIDTNEIQTKLPSNYIMGSSVPTDKDDEIDAIKAITDNLPDSGALTTISADLKRVLGLMHENVYIDNPVFDNNTNLISARIRIYSVAGSVGTGSNVLATYTITAIGTDAGKFTTWKMVKA